MIQWGPSLEIGLPAIDNQHRELIERANNLVAAMRARKGAEAISEVAEFLREYVVEHFGDEEALMIKHAYPKYDFHKSIHDAFKTDFKIIALKLQSSQTKVGPTIEIQQKVMDWLRKHIQGTDVAFAKYLKEIGAV